MPESRDRLSRHEDVLVSYSNRMRISRNTGRGDSVISVLEDEADGGQATRTPFRWRGTAMVGTPAPVRGIIGTPRVRAPSSSFRSPVVGRENPSPVVWISVGRGFGRGSSVLPSWYPRKHLGDITSVMKALEKGRVRWGETEGLQHESPILQDRTPHRPSIFASDAHPEHDVSMITPHHPTIQTKRCPPTIGKVPKILLDITNKNDGDSDCLTPQKKLLNNIDMVEKVVMEELRKVKRTPLAKRAEREKRLRTLMSMR